MVPLLKFYFHEEVRQAAVQAVPELLKSVYMAVSEGKANGADMQYVKQMLDYVWQPLIDSMIKVSAPPSLTSPTNLNCTPRPHISFVPFNHTPPRTLSCTLPALFASPKSGSVPYDLVMSRKQSRVMPCSEQREVCPSLFCDLI